MQREADRYGWLDVPAKAALFEALEMKFVLACCRFRIAVAKRLIYIGIGAILNDF